MSFEQKQANTISLINLNASAFAERLKNDPGAVLIDVRTKFEYNNGHIPQSILIDIMNPAFQTEIDNLDRQKNYYLYCRSGNRSYHAGMFMTRAGFKNVVNLAPGILGWMEPLVTE